MSARTASTAPELMEMLHRHLIPDGRPAAGILTAEVQDPTGMRRADAIWVPMGSGRRGRIVGYELKVSRADVLAELLDVTKADAWARYCDEWWLVIGDPDIVDGLDIPEHWGILAPPSGRNRRTMTVLRPAPALHPVERSAALAEVLAKCFYAGPEIAKTMQDTRERAVRAELRAKDYQQQLWELQASVRSTQAVNSSEISLVNEVVAGLRVGRPGAPFVPAGIISADDILDALWDIAAVRRRAQEMESALRMRMQDLERVTKSIAQTMEDQRAKLDQALAQPAEAA